MDPKDLARPLETGIQSKLCQSVLNDIKWLAQEKLNGWRGLWDGKKMWTRHGNEVDKPFKLPDFAVLDGEIMGDKFYAFDLLEYKGRDFTGSPLSERWMYLKNLKYNWEDAGYGELLTVPATQIHKEEAYREWLSRGAEGMVLKCLREPYPPKNGAVWFKVKP